MIDRKELLTEIKEEKRLRKLIRKGIKLYMEGKLNKENRLRQVIRELIPEVAKTDVPDAQPHRSTGINVLEDLLRNIIPIVEDGYKALTSDKDQRESFRAHILNAVENSLKPVAVVADLPKSDEPLEEQDLTIKVDAEEGDEDLDKFIPVRDIDMPQEEEEEDTFSIEGADETGRNFASITFNKVEKQILDSYESLANKEDAKLFYDYLLTNLKLYFDKFEDEILPAVPEPDSPDYEKKEDEEVDLDF